MYRFVMLALSIIAVLTPRSFIGAAQRTTANVYGAVKDSSGALVPGVTVQFIHEQTGVQEKVLSNEVGEFSANFLPIGRYTAVVEAPGFTTFRQKALELTAGQQIRHIITLEVGEVTQEIEVVAEAPSLLNASVQLSESLNQLKIQELPQVRRDFTQLLILQPGAVRNTTEFIQFNGLAGIE